jgi:5'-deoxynucleotidase YfbR-like HD superfamily hydrolase
MNFIETRSGQHFAPLNPDPDHLSITDIAHALSHQCRFSGHTKVAYSVAEHSVRVADLLQARGANAELVLAGLMHDASEAYLVDLPTPLKDDPRFSFYRTAEMRLMDVIASHFGFARAWKNHQKEIRDADLTLLATEARDLMAYRPGYWDKLTHAPLPTTIIPWGAEAARGAFYCRFQALQDGAL